jgi:uncharacterized protein YdiU (UPF0061 family)
MMDDLNTPLNGPPLISALTGQQVCFAFDNTYARLPEHFYKRLDPTPVTAPRIVKVNVELALELGVDADALTNEHGVAVLAGNMVTDGAGLCRTSVWALCTSTRRRARQPSR